VNVGERCSMTGYRGRLAVTEIVIADAELERAIATNGLLRHDRMHRLTLRQTP